MACPQEKANEFCSCQHLAKTKLGTGPASEIAAMLGVPDRWWTPYGHYDVTYLVRRSNIGDLRSKAWKIHGWILDAESENRLRLEFPYEWLLGVTCSLGFPRDYSRAMTS